MALADENLRFLRETGGRAHFLGDCGGDFIVAAVIDFEAPLEQREALLMRGA